MASEWVVLGAAAVGAGGVLLGQLLSARNEQARLATTLNNERQQRREDLRRAAYESAITAIDEMYWTSSDIRQSLIPNVIADRPRFDAALQRLDAADSRVQLVGSPAAREALQRVIECVSSKLQPATLRPGDWTTASNEMKALFREFVDTARADIGVTDTAQRR